MLGLVVAFGCAHMQERKACREHCDQQHPGEKVRVLYGSPSDAYMACVTACDRGTP